LADLGLLRIEQRRWNEASELLDSALEIAANVGDDHCRGLSHGYHGQNELERGDLKAARDHFERAVQVLAEVGDRRWVAHFRAAHAAVETLLDRKILGQELFEEAARELDSAGKGDDALVFEGWRAIASGQAEQAQALLAKRPANQHFHWRAVCRVVGALQEKPAMLRLSIAADARWFELGGERVSLARRGSLRRILLELVRTHETDPASAIGVAELFEAGWPDQRIRADSSAHRVHVAMATLRKLGLGDLLVTHSEGYALERNVRVERGDEG
jgi:tetratricopeptide (TPR) repeat protein